MTKPLQLLLTLITTSLWCSAGTSNIRRDEEILFFPAVCYESPEGKGWDLKLTGCVFELEERRLALYALRQSLGIERTELTDAENAVFETRAGYFFVDNQRGKRLVIRVGNKTFTTEKSKPNGHFAGSFHLSSEDVRKFAVTNSAGLLSLSFTTVLPAADSRSFSGKASFIRDQGLAVVSDIDDTIKVSQVLDRKALLRNTFVNPFKPVEGMSGLFSELNKSPDTQFFYVSASPWQLYSPLAEFVETNGFPAGVFLLKDFRFKDRSVLNLFAKPERYKVERIEPVLKQFPNRRFMLVGDSGERDPEAYGELARRFPRQIARILIRDMTGDTSESERYRKAFRDLPAGTVTLFKEPSEIRLRPTD